MHDVEAERSRQHPPGPTRSWRVPGLHVAYRTPQNAVGGSRGALSNGGQ